MIRFIVGAAAALLSAGLAASAGATDLLQRESHHHHVGARHWPAQIVYGRSDLRRPYNHEDHGLYDGADRPPHRLAYSQGPSWLDGYGTRSVTYPGYGTTDVYGGSSQGWAEAIPPAGGLAVYSPGAYGPGPRIIHIPGGY